MYCTNCGTPLPEGATACLNCATRVRKVGPRPAVPNYLVHSIVATVCCCVPFGIPAIIYAAQVNSKLALGDIPGAMASSRAARTWCWVAFAAGALVSLGYAALMMFNVAGLK
jgi:hypothetical protein